MTTMVDIVTGLTEGVAQKAPVQCATTANLGTALTGLPVVDGYQLLANDRILVKDQSDTTTNGIYVVSSSAWVRSVDFNDSADIVQGTIVAVNNGTVNGNGQFKITTPNPVPGSAISFTQSSVNATGFLKADGSIHASGNLHMDAGATVAGTLTAAAATFSGEVTVQTPTNPTDADRKDRVDALIAGVSASAPTGSIMMYGALGVPSGWLICDGSAVSRSTYSALFAALVKSSVVTITSASPAVISYTAHPFKANDPVFLTTTGALWTGLTANTTYYVVGGASLHANDFEISATPGGSAINTSGSQSGTHTLWSAPWGKGDGSTTFNLPEFEGYSPRGLDRTGSTDANRSFGSTQADAVGPHTHTAPLTLISLAGGVNVVGTQAGGGSTVHVTTDAQSPSGTTETRVKNIALPFIVKT